MALLEATDLGISFGGLRAVDELNMQIEKGALVGLIGPNGAGKTTVFNMLTGVYRPTDGGIRLDGENIVGRKPHEICKMGIARTFQNIRLFTKLSVLDNVKACNFVISDEDFKAIDKISQAFAYELPHFQTFFRA